MKTSPFKGAVASALAALCALQPGVLRALEAKPAEKEPSKVVRISPGDVVSITVFPVEEYSRELTVQPDGKIEMPLLGSILVKGLSSRELQDLLTDKLSKYVSNPQVTVSVRRFSGRRVAIIGEVRAAGYYEYRDGMRLLELVSLAGGLSENAKASKVRIIRPDAPGGGSIRANLKDVLEGGRVDADPLLQPGDIAYVPKGKLTLSAQWTNTNILPWLFLATLISSIAVVIHTNSN